jgi:hypothetical protein
MFKIMLEHRSRMRYIDIVNNVHNRSSAMFKLLVSLDLWRNSYLAMGVPALAQSGVTMTKTIRGARGVKVGEPHHGPARRTTTDGSRQGGFEPRPRGMSFFLH